ncbi:glycerol-3-phosphate acyltransferase [Jeotgalibacillus sp. ET6]|uniref:glycerol-3-phosphate acyltransferase n=1 Tax=Jeotgalibacillus sp. ET6 TaxID=3037260 RepID=UPI00241843FF|nr:glycerol-3-phosphate acyltransferase [Jeotgalibacillus sp. ET6]MDG5470559.1 glycerol-3-phosphate acyltransferase [Jeotgalibacillus sp. ET6]
MDWIIAASMGYLIGCFHGSQVAGFLKKTDLKESGVKNSGASNATIVLGWKFGILVALIDIGKAIGSVLLIRQLYSNVETYEIFLSLLFVNAVFVVLGHIFPFQMKFQGGKGTASIVGVLFVLDWRIALISISLLLIVTFATDYLVIGVTVMYAAFFILTILFDYPLIPLICVFAVWMISTIKHMENYSRLRKHEETRLSSLINKKKAS